MNSREKATVHSIAAQLEEIVKKAVDKKDNFIIQEILNSTMCEVLECIGEVSSLDWRMRQTKVDFEKLKENLRYVIDLESIEG